VIDDHHRRRNAMALARLEIGVERGRVVSGIDDVWVAALRRQVGMLCVEESFTVQGAGHRPSPGGTGGVTPDADDLVDELIEAVSLSGGEVVLVDDGRLDRHGRVAALIAQ
jgi:hypothetical protein